MNGVHSLIQQWQLPSSKFLLRNSKHLHGKYLFGRGCVYPIVCFCKSMQTNTYEVVKGSYVPTTQTAQNPKSKDEVSIEKENVGAFQKLPMVMPSVDILYSSLRKAKRISPTKGIANAAKRERNKGAKQLDALMKELAAPLRDYVDNFPKKKYLHPYERSLVELTLGDGNYEEVLMKVDTLRKKVTSVGKEHASLCAKTLRAMPVVDLETPTLCLVGAPNVGKSSLVRILSTGKPEVTDTPGLLRRHDEDRNNLEKLTLAVLSHLPTAILYVHDLSGECGMSPSDQYWIYKEIKERFNDHLWLDVISKSDLLQESPVVFISEDPTVDNDEMVQYRKEGPDGAIHVSVKSEQGLNELKQSVHKLLVAQMDRIKDQTSVTCPENLT
ncbi:hypothetical protein BT93_I1690 [Corymbia citriodora subsp. variegata]|nr:hypothetical protein BT93_I1690 [Corymbia citriodora subsp. variegata]